MKLTLHKKFTILANISFNYTVFTKFQTVKDDMRFLSLPFILDSQMIQTTTHNILRIWVIADQIYMRAIFTLFLIAIMREQKSLYTILHTILGHRVIWSSDKRLTPMALRFFFSCFQFADNLNQLSVDFDWVSLKIALFGIDYCISDVILNNVCVLAESFLKFSKKLVKFEVNT